MLRIKRLMTRYVPGMLTCQQVDECLYPFHQGELGVIAQLKFRVHISMCSECRAYLKRYRNTIRIAKVGFVMPEPTANMPEPLIKIILASRADKKH